MRILVIFLITLAVACLSAGDDSTEEIFEGTRVYKVNVQNAKQLKELWKLTQDMQLEVLQDFEPERLEYFVIVDAEHQRRFEERLRKLNYLFQVFIENVLSALKDRLPNFPKPKMEWTQYHSLADISNWLDYIGQQFRPFLKMISIGESYEGRPIKAAKLSVRKGNKAIFVESGIHAPEWISSAAGTCFLNNLLTSDDAYVRQLILNYDWIFVPMLNPDGFHYSHKGNPLWRKNRKPTGFTNSSGICYGTDLNRNFNYKWKVAGWNSRVPCDHWYGGATPDSEPEVKALQGFVNRFPDGYIRMYLALHSFGNMLLLPYGHTTTERPPNYDQMLRISKGFADRARQKFNTTFRYGTSGELLSVVSGASKDWAYGVKGIPYTVTVELRDNGKYGFFLPANQIKDVCAELTDGIVGMVKAAAQENFFS